MAIDKAIDSAQLDGALQATAEAIRTKSESADPIPWDMDKGFEAAVLAIEGGGAELNFEVVGGMTEPENPKENTIWVETETEITGYIFSSKQPDSLESGNVWIEIDKSGSITLSALKSDEIFLTISQIKQHNGEALEIVPAYVYRNNEWLSFARYLFPISASSDIKFIGVSNTNSGYRIGSTEIELWQTSTNGGNISNVYTEAKLPFQAGETLIFDAICTEQHASPTGDWAKRVGIYSAHNGSTTSSISNLVAGTLLTADGSRRLYKVPITTGGSYHVACCGGGDVVIYAIYVQ